MGEMWLFCVAVFNLEKTFKMTFSLLVLHMWLCLRRMKEEGKEGVELGQYLYEIYNHDVELRVSKAGVCDYFCCQFSYNLLLKFYIFPLTVSQVLISRNLNQDSLQVNVFFFIKILSNIYNDCWAGLLFWKRTSCRSEVICLCLLAKETKTLAFGTCQTLQNKKQMKWKDLTHFSAVFSFGSLYDLKTEYKKEAISFLFTLSLSWLYEMFPISQLIIFVAASGVFT